MSDVKYATIANIPVWFVLHDAETVRANLRILTSHYHRAGSYLGELIDEVTKCASPADTVGDCSPYLQSLLLQMIRIIDGDLSVVDTPLISPVTQVGESHASYGMGLNSRIQRTPSRPAARTSEPASPPKVATKPRQIRNPPWTREEILLATELYVKNDGRLLGPNDTPIIELSELLNRLPIIPLAMRSEKFRNPEGVGLKLSNIRAADPTRPGGSPHGNRLDGYFWNVLDGNEEVLFAIVKEIKVQYGLDAKE